MITTAAFRKIIYEHYRRYRRDLPWRHTIDPYHIMVSELMLQQTQVDRVVGKYISFIKKFPTIGSLARASLSAVLKAWQGLGYNRRAKYLHMAAGMVVTSLRGKFPRTIDELVTLPGIGVHTAGAICAYAFNQPVAYIETNIRSAYIYHFFPRAKQVTDAQLMPLVIRTLDERHPRRWYSALMDYGTWLKKNHGNAAQRSRHYTKQSRFEGSHRQVRGAIIRALATSRGLTTGELHQTIGLPVPRIRSALEQLISEGMVRLQQGQYRLA
ncbi:MAG: A/G-specific adenine glycosylase [Candidatus Kerfeldbacteria bacterium]|nr:A/G-specific adenine glycosylase [Candidatus Kerfeldbacteria bacterium]